MLVLWVAESSPDGVGVAVGTGAEFVDVDGGGVSASGCISARKGSVLCRDSESAQLVHDADGKTHRMKRGTWSVASRRKMCSCIRSYWRKSVCTWVARNGGIGWSAPSITLLLPVTEPVWLVETGNVGIAAPVDGPSAPGFLTPTSARERLT